MKAQQIVPNVLSGIILTVYNTLPVIPFGAMLFSGPLAAHRGTAIALLLVSSVVIGLGALGSGYRGMLAAPRAPMIPVMAAMVSTMAGTMVDQGREADLLVTVIATIGITSIVSGLTLGLLGLSGLGRLVRYLPYPVVAGFFASVGFSFVTGGLSIAADRPISWDQLSAWLSAETSRQWVLALAYGVVIYIVQHRWNQWFVMPLSLLLGLAAFHALVRWGGHAVEEATVSAWLPQFPASAASVPLVDYGDLSRVYWPAVVEQGGSIAAIVILGAILLLVDVAAIETAVNRDIEIDRELKTSGAANVVSGLIGGCPGVQSVPHTALARKLGGDRRVMGCVYVAGTAVMAGTGGKFAGLFPVFLLGGLLIYLGMGFLRQWVWETAKELSWTEYLVVLLILVTSIWKGVLAGMALGLSLSVMLFVVAYSLLGSIRSEFSGRDHRSHIERDPEARKVLDQEGGRILIMGLQGALFFGTATDLIAVIRKKLESQSASGLRYLILDLKHVSFVDASGVRSFARLAQFTEHYGVSVAVTGGDGKTRRQLERSGFFTGAKGGEPRVRRCHFARLDDGVAWCEERILGELGARGPAGGDGLEERLAAMLQDVDAARELARAFQRREYAAGDWLFRSGEAGDALYVVYAGTLSVVTDGADGGEHVVRVYTSGAMLGEMAVYTGRPRTAGVRSDTSSVVFRLDADALNDLQLRNPAAAGRFHTFVIKMIAGRLDRSTRELGRQA